MTAPWGEMLDLIACLNVYNGAELASEPDFTSFDAQWEVE